MLERRFLLKLTATWSLIVMTKDAEANPVVGSGMAPARPGHFAELEELNAARKQGTVAAYDLFLARHPTSRYAAEARKERAKLAR